MVAFRVANPNTYDLVETEEADFSPYAAAIEQDAFLQTVDLTMKFCEGEFSFPLTRTKII